MDQTIKSQQETIDSLKKRLEAKARETFMGAFKAAVEERKDDIEALLKQNSGSLKLTFDFNEQEQKDASITVNDDITRIAWGTTLDTTIAADRVPANVFYEAFGKDTINGLFFNWLEGTYTDATDYVDELAAMSDSEAKAEEKTRRLSKFGAHLLVSSEVTDFFTALYDWARGKAQQKLIEFADKEIFNGAGADTSASTQKKIYGIKSQATAFNALGEYADPTIADVLLDAIAQAKKEGFNANAAFVSYADEASFRGLKDKNGHYLYNEATGMLGALRILPSRQLASGKVLVADLSVVRIKERPTYELEIVRNAKLDGWDIYLRKAIQTLVKGPDKKGLIWIDSISAAITAITKA